ncbi:MAG: sigma-70 family RNA polymerase sigma factor [Gemmatimonadales bacterium]
MPAPTSVTDCLARLRDGDAGALDRLLPLVYDELRALAGAQLRHERTGHTLSATALVHEAYVRLADRDRLGARDRSHFFAIAAQSMRRVLIDHARGRRRLKRGQGQDAVPLDAVADLVGDQAAEELLALDAALDRLALLSPRAAQVVERRFFAGLSMEETAESMGTSVRTVRRDWVQARAWLRKEIATDLPA